MEESPRSSKRRKIDTPKRIASSPLTKGLSTRASGRLTNRSVSYTNGVSASDVDEEGEPEPTSIRPSRATKKATNGTPAKGDAAVGIDVYDDIEGALSVDPAPKPAKKAARAPKKQAAASTAEEPQPVAVTPKRGRGRPRKIPLIRKDDLPLVATTPPKRGTTQSKPTSTRKTPVAKASGRKRLVDISVDEDETADDSHDGINGASPTKQRSARKKVSSARLRDTSIPDTEDELAERIPNSSRKTSVRRRVNRTDNIGNGDDKMSQDEIEVDAEDDMDIDGNSVVGSVLDPTEPSPFYKPSSAQKAQSAPLIYGNFPGGRALDQLKSIILERITGKRPLPLVGIDEEYKTVHQLIEQTVTAGEGNSMLLIGARGSGKTALVNKVLSEVAKDNGGEYHVVRLNGFIHTDDKIALREIWRQLGKEMDIEEDGSGPGKNYADTLTTLLALLSHPSEQTGEVTDQVAKAVIFVMDEFDMFAQHPRQTLLYNLFDIAQSRKAPIAVLGLTTRIDVTNSLEKRVKSRFSHRYVHLSLAKTFTAFQEICKSCLLIKSENLSVEERGILEDGVKTTEEAKSDVLAEWNANINKLFSSPSFLTQHLAPHFYTTKSIPAVLNTFYLPTALLSPTTPFLPTNTLKRPDSNLTLITSLSTLGLSLLIAAARLDIIHDSDTCNFNMAYDEYVTLASKARIQSAAGGLSASGSVSKVWGKEVASREWEELVELGLIMPVIQGQAGGFSMVRCDVALEEIGAVLAGEKGVDKQLERWCKSL